MICTHANKRNAAQGRRMWGRLGALSMLNEAVLMRLMKCTGEILSASTCTHGWLCKNVLRLVKGLWHAHCACTAWPRLRGILQD